MVSPAPFLVPLLLVAISLAGCAAPTDPADSVTDTPPILSGIHIAGIRHDQVTVNWKVEDDQAGVMSRILWGPHGSAKEAGAQQAGAGEHTQTLTGLLPDTLYGYVVEAVDAAGQTTTAKQLFFGTLPAPADTVAPTADDDVPQFDELTILSVKVFHAGHDNAIITYTVAGAQGAVTSRVEYGPTIPLDGASADVAGEGKQEVTLEGLERETMYRFRVVAEDDEVTSESPTSSFTTLSEPDTAPPTILNVSVIGTTPDKARITWEVEDQSGVRSWIRYGTDASLGQSSVKQDGAGIHTVTLDGLTQSTTYQFAIRAEDLSSNLADSSASTFATLADDPPIISDVNVADVGLNGFNVTFTVSGPSDATTIFEYGTDPSYGSTVEVSGGTGQKSVQLTGLAAATLYHFRITSEAPSGVGQAGDVEQWTATLQSVEIVAGAGPTSFDPSNIQLEAGRPYLFDVTNNDPADAPHTWGIVDPYYETPNLPKNGGHYRFSEAIVLDAGQYEQFCGYHGSMSGTITVA